MIAPFAADTGVEVSPDGVTVPLPDGAVIIDLNPQKAEEGPSAFDDNLALKMGSAELSALAEDLLQGIESDIRSRTVWETTRTRGIELLGLKIEEPKGDVGTTSSPVEGMATVRHPVLLEAVLRAQANASGELLPADGPAKIFNAGDETAATDVLADRLEKDFNYYLTSVATEYYPDTRRTLFWSSFGGSHFKKLYHCPIRRRPVSEGVDANDLIVSDASTDLANAPRVTHRIKMPPSIMKRMQIVGAYRDVTLTAPQLNQSQVDRAKGMIEGVLPPQDRPEDQPYTIYECYCEVVLDQFAPTQFKGKALPLPFKVSIDKDSREVLEVRRFWGEDDPQCQRKKRFVKYPYVEAMGIYGIGLLHILGNLAMALTGAVREALDAGMFANFPGGLIAKGTARQNSNEFRIAPGSFPPIETNGMPIQQAVMALPYKDVTPGLMTLIDKLKEDAQRVGSMAELPVGEGKQDAPVGTTLALIEQATKVEGAVHKGLHHAQAEEFEILLELFREDPEAFWRHNPECEKYWDTEKLTAALDDCTLVPKSDPNTPSHLHRVAKALAIKQLQAANPGLYNARAVDERVLRMIHVDDPDSLFAPPPPPQVGPPQPTPDTINAQAKLIAAQSGAAKVQVDAASAAADAQNKQAERISNEKIATLNLAKELVIHSDNSGLKQQQHGLALRQHGLDAAQAAHSALMDVHDAMNQPQPGQNQ